MGNKERPLHHAQGVEFRYWMAMEECKVARRLEELLTVTVGFATSAKWTSEVANKTEDSSSRIEEMTGNRKRKAADSIAFKTEITNQTEVTKGVDNDGDVSAKTVPRIIKTEVSDGNKMKEIKHENENHADADVLDELRAEALRKLMEVFEEVNSRPFYDAEENALGRLSKTHYLILPADVEFAVCPASAIGLGLEEYKLSEAQIASVYVLAKEQALSFGWDDVKAVKWACVRLQSVRAGWYAGQEFVVRKPAPIGALQVFRADAFEVSRQLEGACKLCGFIPFIIEVCFRQFTSAFNSVEDSQDKFVSVVKRLAKSTKYEDVINYMDAATLYGDAFRWIGVKRPKEAIKEACMQTRIPNVFLSRNVTTAGQAVITTAVAIIEKMKAINWWDGVAKAGGYNEGKLVTVSEKITANPWKYHTMSEVYGEAPLSSDEAQEVDEAKALAIKFAPILQAFVNVKFRNDSISKLKTLAKYAKANGKIMYNRALGFFRRVAKGKAKIATPISPASEECVSMFCAM